MAANVWRDVRLAVRSYSKRPGFASSTLLIAALGLGATTSIFSVVDAVMLRDLGYPQEAQLVSFDRGSHPVARFRDWQEAFGCFDSMAAGWGVDLALTGGGHPERLHATRVTRDFLPTFGAQPILGRLFTRDEFRGDPRVAVISHGLWVRRFASDASVLGARIDLNGIPTRVVGVLGRDFREPTGVVESGVDVWLPLDITIPELQEPNLFVLDVVGHLREGVTIDVAREELRIRAPDLAAKDPDLHATRSGEPAEIQLVPLRKAMVGDTDTALLLLLGAVSVMLLIACANIANLLLARAADRDQEVAVRIALGAGRRRILAQLLTESMVLSLAGGVVGTALAYVAVGAFRALGPADFPRMSEVAVDLRVLGFALSASLLTGVLFGLAPAWRGARTSIAGIIKNGSATTGVREAHRLRSILVVGEIAMTLILLAGAGLLMNSFVRVNNVAPGFEVERLVMVPIRLGDQFTGAQRTQFVEGVLESIRAIPGVSDVSVALNTPFVRLGGSRCCWAKTMFRTERGREVDEFMIADWVTPGYFRTLGATVRGRDFRPSDVGASPVPMVVSEEAAAAFFPGGEALGLTVIDDDDVSYVITGVVSGLHYWGLDQGTEMHLFVPHLPFLTQTTGLQTILVRSAGDPRAIAPSIRKAIWAVEPTLPVDEVTTMRQRVASSTAFRRFQSILFASFASVAVLLAAMGIYGSTLYVVSQRRREFGIRVAMGAQRGDVVRLVLRRGAAQAALGVAVGTAAALALGRFLESWLFGVSAADGLTIASVGAFLAGVALLASWIPARRATLTNPLDTLRVG